MMLANVMVAKRSELLENALVDFINILLVHNLLE